VTLGELRRAVRSAFIRIYPSRCAIMHTAVQHRDDSPGRRVEKSFGLSADALRDSGRHK
jgi:hypothetical protein